MHARLRCLQVRRDCPCTLKLGNSRLTAVLKESMQVEGALMALYQSLSHFPLHTHHMCRDLQDHDGGHRSYGTCTGMHVLLIVHKYKWAECNEVTAIYVPYRFCYTDVAVDCHKHRLLAYSVTQLDYVVV